MRSLVDKMGARPEAPFDLGEPVAPLYAAEELYGIYESDISRQYDMREILARVVDGSRFDEYKAGYGETLLCGYARIDGTQWALWPTRSCTLRRSTTRATSAPNSAE